MDNENPPDQSEERPRIKVTDRRKFTADGNLRPGGEEAPSPHTGGPAERASAPVDSAAGDRPASPGADTRDEPGAPPPGATPPAMKPDEPEPEETKSAESKQAEAAPGATRPPEPHPPEAPATADTGEARDGDDSPIVGPQPRISDLPRDFAALVEGMYFEAMLYLGAIPDPRSGQVMHDPDVAKYKIDLLSTLKAKTEGNLTVEEKRQLEEALYQLRMAYLQVTKTAKL